MKPVLASALTLAVTFTVSASAMAQTAAPLSAKDSNPETMGWMQGFPPSADKTIRFTDPDFFTFPKLRWTVCHFRQLMPNVGVSKGSAGARPLAVALDPALDSVSFTPLGADTTMTWDEAFAANYTDGIIVLHHGRVVYERYDGCLKPDSLHAVMSVTKSIAGLLGEMLVAEGKLDDAALAGSLIPELKDSAFGDATVRQVMDMTTALAYSEDADLRTYSMAGSPLPKPKDYTGPRSYFEYLQTVKKGGTHGEAFAYKTVNADAMGWLVARSSGQSVAELFSERIWSRIGAEREAFFTADSIGTPFAGGGFNATLRDMARLGQMMLDDGRVGSEQIVPAAAIARIRNGGQAALFAKAGYTRLPGWSYGGLWWISNDEHGAYAARGVYGQTIWVDPKADMVIVRFASNPVAANAANDPTSLPAYRAVANYLMAHDGAPLLGQEWVIEDIAGSGVIDNSHATLHFLADGSLAGSATCNRIIGRYQTDGERLSIAPAGTTMMACPAALMNQERKLLALLPTVERYRIDESGALVLTAADGTKIVARRQAAREDRRN